MYVRPKPYEATHTSYVAYGLCPAKLYGSMLMALVYHASLACLRVISTHYGGRSLILHNPIPGSYTYMYSATPEVRRDGPSYSGPTTLYGGILSLLAWRQLSPKH